MYKRQRIVGENGDVCDAMLRLVTCLLLVDYIYIKSVKSDGVAGVSYALNRVSVLSLLLSAHRL